VETVRQLSLFGAERLARRPYCTDDPASGVRIRGIEHALKHSHIQANSPALRWRLVFDVDRPAAVFAAEDAGLAPPNWLAENPKNGHAHIAYEIETPIVTSENGRSDPLRFAAAVELGYMRGLRADVSYAGLICKNPTHPDWRTQIHRVKPYDLSELAEWCELPKRLTKRDAAASPLGRNVTVFDRLRTWAYKNVRRYADGHGQEWLFACRMQAAAFNDFDVALPLNEVEHIARSVAKWVWTRFDIQASDARFSTLQAHRAALSGKTRAAKADARAAEALAMAAQGMTQRAIALALGVSQKTVSNLLHRFE
jgi:hypothetical protein